MKRSIALLYPLETKLVMVDNNTSVSKEPTKESTTKGDRDREEEAPEEEVHLTMTTMATVKKERNENAAPTKLKPS